MKAMEAVTKQLGQLEKRGYDFVLLLKSPCANSQNSEGEGTRVVCSDGMNPLLLDQLHEVFCNETRVGIETISERSSIPTKVLYLQDKQAVNRYFHEVFKTLKQLPRKTIAKLWIRIIEPRKKTKFPYVKGNNSKPSWWPEDVDHREPDHLKRLECIKLMTAILADFIPSLNDPTTFHEIRRSTELPSLFKNDKFKQSVLEDAYKVCWGLFSKHTAVTVFDLEKAVTNKSTQLNEKRNNHRPAPLEEDDKEYLQLVECDKVSSLTPQNYCTDVTTVFSPKFVGPSDFISSSTSCVYGDYVQCEPLTPSSQSLSCYPFETIHP